jgi:hypothetical protein
VVEPGWLFAGLNLAVDGRAARLCLCHPLLAIDSHRATVRTLLGQPVDRGAAPPALVAALLRQHAGSEIESELPPVGVKVAYQVHAANRAGALGHDLELSGEGALLGVEGAPNHTAPTLK